MERMVLVCGSRGWGDPVTVHAHLDRVLDTTTGPLTVVTADRLRVDRYVADWAKRNDVTHLVFHTDWVNDGYLAVPRCNNRMIEALEDARLDGADVSISMFRLPCDRRSAELDRIEHTAKVAAIHGTVVRALAAA